MIARAFALCAALAVAACSGSKTPDARPNVLLITLDTVRADRLGCYGYARARTPNLDALAKRGVRFERAYATVPYTLPAHASILTGLYPPAHGLHVNFQGSVPAEAQSVAAGFQAAGYRTGALVASGVLDRRFGLARGFDSYDDLHDRPLNQSSQVERPGSEVSAAAVKWLEQASSKPFFAWVHFYDAHDPYEPPEGFRDFAEPYDGEIAFVDVQVGRLVAALERLGKLANTWIVVVADHGEAFGEHGEFGHGLLVYDSTMHVPLIVAGPAPLVAGGCSAFRCRAASRGTACCPSCAANPPRTAPRCSSASTRCARTTGRRCTGSCRATGSSSRRRARSSTISSRIAARSTIWLRRSRRCAPGSTRSSSAGARTRCAASRKRCTWARTRAT
jgi:arylsulfatase A-like enzyme